MADVLIVTFGLTSANQRLMPWRTVMEVAQGIAAKGHLVTVLSVSTSAEVLAAKDRIEFVHIARGPISQMKDTLGAATKGRTFDVIFLPVSWSPNLLMRRLLGNLGGLRIAYVPGSVFEVSQVISVAWKMPLRAVLPYLAQAAFPTFLLSSSLRALGVSAIIVNSEYTRRHLESYVGTPTVVIPPGKDDPTKFSLGISASGVSSKATSPYFLFMGPPSNIRGINVLAEAYLRIADDPSVPSLLCLFRDDPHLDIVNLRVDFTTRWKHNKLKLVWRSVPPEELQRLVQGAVAVVMPFLIVPSEIPLAVYEAAGMGKKVITTGPSGTGEFVASFGEVVRHGDIEDLAGAMLRISRQVVGQDIDSWSPTIDEKALEAFFALDNWQTVADKWWDVACKCANHTKNTR